MVEIGLGDVPQVAVTPLQVTPFDATPDTASETLPVTFAVVAATVLPSAGELMATEGAVVSTFAISEIVVLLPARSRQVPVTGWFAPSLDTAIGGD